MRQQGAGGSKAFGLNSGMGQLFWANSVHEISQVEFPFLALKAEPETGILLGGTKFLLRAFTSTFKCEFAS